jgi:hypothetical protein
LNVVQANKKTNASLLPIANNRDIGFEQIQQSHPHPQHSGRHHVILKIGSDIDIQGTSKTYHSNSWLESARQSCQTLITYLKLLKLSPFDPGMLGST